VVLWVKKIIKFPLSKAKLNSKVQTMVLKHVLGHTYNKLMQSSRTVTKVGMKSVNSCIDCTQNKFMNRHLRGNKSKY